MERRSTASPSTRPGIYGIVIYHLSGSATFSNTKVSGTPSGGLSNLTTTFTIVRGPGNSGF